MGLVSTKWLAEHLQDPAVRICDVRWSLPSTGRSGAREYAAGHIPGAVFINLDRALAAADDGREGRHPLPPADIFVAAMRAAGIGHDTHVVAYDDTGGSTAARLWWLLRAHGHESVSLLDGGLPSWLEAGGSVTSEVSAVGPGDFASRWDNTASVDLAGAERALLSGALLVDVRARERYRGVTEPVDPRPGHIPGAVNSPFSELLDHGRFLSPERLRERCEGLIGSPADRTSVIASCGSGVTACHLLFALDLTGLRPFPAARLYAGSYSEWSRHGELPTMTGELPGAPI